MAEIEKESNLLFFEESRLEPVSSEENMVGFCETCGGELKSCAYYRVQEGWMVASRCLGCENLVLMRYDLGWSWLGDTELNSIEPSTKSKFASISSIPREKLEVVFTPAELRDMESFERGEPYTRQNLYRARSKFEKFEKLFGVKINL